MPWTDADLAALDAVIAKGELTVEFADRRVTYRAVADLLQARALIAGTLASESDTPPPKLFYGVGAKGF
jgi:hypothetical protein